MTSARFVWFASAPWPRRCVRCRRPVHVVVREGAAFYACGLSSSGACVAEPDEDAA